MAMATIDGLDNWANSLSLSDTVLKTAGVGAVWEAGPGESITRGRMEI